MFIFLYLVLLVCFLGQYSSSIHNLVKIPLIDSVILNILRLLTQKISQFNKRGVQLMSEGVGKISEK